MSTPSDETGIHRDGYVFRDTRTGISVEIADYNSLLAKCGGRHERIALELGVIDGETVILVFIPVRLLWQPDAVPATKNEQESLRRVISFIYKDAILEPYFVNDR